MKMPENKPKAQLIPAGRYKTTIEASEMRKSQAGNEYLYLRHRITEGAYKGTGVSATIIFRSQKTWMQKKGQQRWVELLNALEWRTCPNEENLIGQEVTVELVNKDRNGSAFTEVKSFCMPKTAIEVVEEAKNSNTKADASSW